VTEYILVTQYNFFVLSMNTQETLVIGLVKNKTIVFFLLAYYLCFLKTLISTIYLVEYLLIFFLFVGRGEDARKINWIHWEKICSKKVVGCLGVRKIREFNMTLLGK